jgi:hypothetical protein
MNSTDIISTQLTPSITGGEQINSRAQTLKRLTMDIPNNEFGLPVFIYRVDLLPDDFYLQSRESQDQLLNAAYIEIDYAEGYPTIEGVPVWNRLEFEPLKAYQQFEKYIELKQSHGVRQLGKLANGSPTLKQLKDYFDTYYWASRVKAYDLFLAAQLKHLREQRILSIEDSHYLQAESLLTKLKDFFDQYDTETMLEELEFPQAIKALKELTQIQRVALGLSAQGGTNGGSNQIPAHANLELTLKTLANATVNPDKDNEQGVKSTANQAIEILQGDSDAAKIIQELIIKTGAPN